MSLMQWTLGFVVVNILLLLYLGIFHLRHYNNFRSSFTLGLFLFVIVFLTQNILAAYFYFTMMSLFVEGTELAVFLVMFIETIALLIFTWITNK